MRARFFLPLVLLSVTACLNKGVITGNGLLGVRFAVQDSPAIAASHLSVSRLDAVVAEVVFDADGPSNSISVTQEQHSRVDVLASVSTPPLEPILLETGTYRSVNFGVELLDADGGTAILLEGTLDGVPIRFEFNSAEVFERSAAELVVPDGKTRIVRFLLDPEAWFAGISGGALTLNDEGVAVVSAASNVPQYEQIVERLDQSTDAQFP